MLKSFFQNYFGFNKQQRRGLYVLLLISTTVLVIRLTYARFISPDAIDVAALPMVTINDPLTRRDSSGSAARRASQRQLFYFDPNTVSETDLVDLGLSTKQAASFLKFRSRGVVFRKASDLKKVFVISDWLYKRLSPYVRIAEMPASPQAEKKAAAPPVVQRRVLELNSADSTALTELPGIGPVMARRIVRYRDLLGGFVRIGQLKEVFGVSAELADKLAPLVKIDAAQLQTLRVNTGDFKALARHPYLGFELTKKVFAQRRRGRLNAETMQGLMPDSSAFQRLLPYLSFE